MTSTTVAAVRNLLSRSSLRAPRSIGSSKCSFLLRIIVDSKVAQASTKKSATTERIATAVPSCSALLSALSYRSEELKEYDGAEEPNVCGSWLGKGELAVLAML